MSAFLVDWLNLLRRWRHMIAGIGWIGTSFYFITLDLSLKKREAMKEGVMGTAWEVHGGGFYHVEEYCVALKELPGDLVWFKWEAYLTWLTGFVLLAGQTPDPRLGAIGKQRSVHNTYLTLPVLCAHPDLAGRAALTTDSRAEQSGAGLDRLTGVEFKRFTALNAAYGDRFEIPFIHAVRGASKETILASFEERLGNDREAEFATAIDNVCRILRFRIEDRVAG